MSTPFRISKHAAGDGVARLMVSGDLGRGTCDVLTAVIGNALRETPVRELVVDLRHVGFLDAMGVRALLAGSETAAEHGAGWRVAGVWDMPRRVLEISGLIQQLNVSPADHPLDAAPVS